MLFYYDDFGNDENLSLIESWLDVNHTRLFLDKNDKNILLVNEASSCGRLTTQSIKLSLAVAKNMFPHLADKMSQV